jgi:hypothetical protein
MQQPKTTVPPVVPLPPLRLGIGTDRASTRGPAGPVTHGRQAVPEPAAEDELRLRRMWCAIVRPVGSPAQAED